MRGSISAAAVAGLGGGGAALVARRARMPWWAAGVAGVYAASIASSAGPMRDTYRHWQRQSRAWSELLTGGQAARWLHDVADGARPTMLRAIDTLRDLDAPAAETAARALEDSRVRVEHALAPWRGRADHHDLLDAMNQGYLGGLTVAPMPGSAPPVRLFAVYENTPGWLPGPLRRRFVPVLRLVDAIRLIHNDDIERRSLVATLWLRAAIVVSAPFAGAWSLTGMVPSASTGPVENAVYGACAVGALVTALMARRVVSHTVGQPTRWGLYAADQTLAVAAVLAVPCWPVAVYAAGAVNWLERPDWTLRKLLAWMAITYVPFAAAAAAGGAEPSRIAGEAAVAIAITALTAGSYGLMAPVTAATFARAMADSVVWRARAFHLLERERRELRRQLAALQRELQAHEATSAAAADARRRVALTRAQLRFDWRAMRRRPRRLEPLLARALGAVVVPEGIELPPDVPPPQLRASVPIYRPRSLTSAVVASGRDARRLDRLLRRIAQEAVDKDASGLISTFVTRAGDGGVEIEIANAAPERPQQGFGTGAVWLRQAELSIPGARIVSRGKWAADHPEIVGDVFSVVIRLGPSVFEARP